MLTTTITTSLPRLKPYARERVDGAIVLTREAGVELTLDDADGRVGALLDLLDGSRDTGQIAADLGSITEDDVAGAIHALDEAGLLENAGATCSMSPEEQARYLSNTSFFGTYASLETSRFAYQERLRRAHVVLLGAGGLGSTLLLSLAGLGVGRVTLVDFDRIELKNLTRQFLYTEAQIGDSKVLRAADRALALNSGMEIDAIEGRIECVADVAALLDGADLLLGAIDTPRDVFEWINEACVKARVPFVTGGMQVGRGLLYSVDPGRSGCLACALQAGSTPPNPERTNRATAPAAMLLGALIAWEALRYLTAFAEPAARGRLWLVDFASGKTDVAFEWDRVPDCPVCGALEAAA
jgi:molybdopterin/thiamine biosynthesis adenylyltransferase